MVVSPRSTFTSHVQLEDMYETIVERFRFRTWIQLNCAALDQCLCRGNAMDRSFCWPKLFICPTWFRQTSWNLFLSAHIFDLRRVTFPLSFWRFRMVKTRILTGRCPLSKYRGLRGSKCIKCHCLVLCFSTFYYIQSQNFSHPFIATLYPVHFFIGNPNWFHESFDGPRRCSTTWFGF